MCLSVVKIPSTKIKATKDIICYKVCVKMKKKIYMYPIK